VIPNARSGEKGHQIEAEGAQYQRAGSDLKKRRVGTAIEKRAKQTHVHERSDVGEREPAEGEDECWHDPLQIEKR
jgi:hypothetical protein